MAKKAKHPSWFKLWLHHKALIEAVPDEVAGKAIKAALNYFATGEATELGQMEAVVFAAIKPDVDEAHTDYLRDVANGKKGGRPKTTTDEKPPVKEDNPPLPMAPQGEREGDGEREREGDGEGKGCEADNPPTRHRFFPPTVAEVREYCLSKGYAVDPDRFVDYYTSNGWIVGKTKMKDWRAAVRTWSGKEKKNGKAEPKPLWSVGTEV